MIRTNFPDFLAVSATVFLAAVFLLWILSEMARRNRRKHALHQRVQCSLCGLVFDNSDSVLLPECPRCGRLNERQPFVEI